MYRLPSLTALLAALCLPASALANTSALPVAKPEIIEAPAGPEIAMMRPTIQTDATGESPVQRQRRTDRKPLAVRFAPAAEIITLVDVSDQTMTVFVDGERAHVWKVSTAGKGYKTPRGMWQPYRMHSMWYSRKYDNAPMPNSIFYDGGYAIHATPHVRRLGKPASHGCVRLHPDDAKTLFHLVLDRGRANTRVVVQN